MGRWESIDLLLRPILRSDSTKEALRSDSIVLEQNVPRVGVIDQLEKGGGRGGNFVEIGLRSVRIVDSAREGIQNDLQYIDEYVR